MKLKIAIISILTAVFANAASIDYGQRYLMLSVSIVVYLMVLQQTRFADTYNRQPSISCEGTPRLILVVPCMVL